MVATVLTAIVAVAALALWLVPRASLEVLLAVPVLGGLTLIAARLFDRPAVGARSAVPAFLVVGWLLVSLCALLVVSVPGPYFPATDTVLPAPDGLRATVHPHSDADCGSGTCQVTIEITGRPGQAAADLRSELTRHLKARGWGSGCRPTGWLLDGSTACVELSVSDGRATIFLTGNRDNVRATTL
ncbi:hypothetical protein [Paractinoplanes atraurantiacus]|uniref:Uncharacterized protein n=1 Tax=Paractinoplanes atraurantiacus TaxID=1036182 RepID=A0A285K1R2_9ACTN|nr:hypothetical protein [Actinoplanes atraurantiacus]SNY66529.1 hypothetical protein SAMN05421748_13059 [Actinoplanes atraurantiacus]